jgi:hypothetical protein
MRIMVVEWPSDPAFDRIVDREANPTPLIVLRSVDVKRQPAAEGHKHADSGRDEPVEDSRFGRIAALDCVHRTKVSSTSDEHMFVPSSR